MTSIEPEPDCVVGENPCFLGFPFRAVRSGVEAVLGAADKISAHKQALDEIRVVCEQMEFSTVSKRVLAILEAHNL